MDLSGHKVVVTGGSEGIGFAIAQAFLERANDVVICGRREERLAVAAGNLRNASTVRCDVTVDDDLKNLVSRSAELMGGISILVNNAGVQFNDLYGETDPDTILQHVSQEVDTNLSGLVKLTALTLPHLVEQEQAAIINLSSVLALAPKQSAPVYCATKAAVRSFTKSLRHQLEDMAPHIRVVEVLPPLVNTAMTRGRGEKGLKPNRVARDLMRGLEQEDHEIKVGSTKRVAMMQRLSPDWVANKMRRR